METIKTKHMRQTTIVALLTSMLLIAISLQPVLTVMASSTSTDEQQLHLIRNGCPLDKNVWSITVDDVNEKEKGFLRATTLYVDDDNTMGPWDGTLEHPFQYIQDGIDHATNDDTIFVFNGTYYENVAVNKSINLIGENKNMTIIDGGGTGDVVNITADDVTLSNFSIQNSGGGIPVKLAGIHINSNNSTISDTLILNNYTGILVSNSNYNTLIQNTINAYKAHGIFVSCSNYTIIRENRILNCDEATMFVQSHYNIITENIITTNTHYATGLFAYDSSNNIISKNIIADNDDGIILSHSSSNNLISENTISSHWNYGIKIYISSNNTIVENTITNNRCNGIFISDLSDYNSIYHNNFVNNTQNAYDEGVNIWDNGYPSGGNYWDDYTGIDADDDGVGDTPYDIPGDSNQDRYPLIYMWTSVAGDLDGDGDVDLSDLAQLLTHYGISSDATYWMGDLDGDGDVDLVDLSLLLAHYGEGI